MRMIKSIVVMAAVLTGMVGLAGDSAPFILDTRNEPVVESSIAVSWDASWVGGDSGATVVIADNGVEICRKTGSGDFTHSLAGTGRHELSYTTHINGVAQEEIYSAVVFKSKYSIRFNSNGGEGQMDDCHVPLDSVAMPKCTFTKEGHFLLGWALTPDGEATLLDGDSTADIVAEEGETVTLYAVWHEGVGVGNGLSVKYYDASSSGYSIWTQSEAAMTNCFAGLAPTIVANTIDWGDRLSSGMAGYGDQKSKMISVGMTGLDDEADCCFHGKYADESSNNFSVLLEGYLSVDASGEYAFATLADDNLVLYIDGNRVCAASWSSVAQGRVSLEPGMYRIAMAFREGSGRQGFNVQWKKPGDTSYSPLPQSALLYGNVTTYTTYAIRFDSNGGEGVMPKRVCVTGDDVALPENGFTRGGFTFVGWAVEPDGSIIYADNAVVGGGMEVTNRANVTLYARWGVDVSFDAGGGEISGGWEQPPSRTVMYDDMYGELPTVTRTGYTFGGWMLGNDVVTSNTVVKTASDHTLVARWTANEYVVTFDVMGGVIDGGGTAGTPYRARVSYDSEYGELPAVTRMGYTFGGWMLGNDVVTSNTVVKTAEDHTLVARWTANRYTVQFDANGGEGTMDGLDMTVSTGAMLSECGFSRPGWLFVGWATEPDGEIAYSDVAEVIDLTYEPNASVVLYAVWMTLGEAVGTDAKTKSIPWTVTDGDDWTIDFVTNHDGDASLRSGVVPPAAEEGERTQTTLTATVFGAGSGSFWWKVSCEGMDEEFGEWYDYAVFTVDGEEVAKIAGDSGWQKVEYEVAGNRSHVLSWTFTRDNWDEPDADWENALWLDEFGWTKVVTLGDVASADEASAMLPWATGGNSDWTIDETTGSEGGNSAKSGSVASGESSWIEVEVDGPGTAAFMWDVQGGTYRGKQFAYATIEVDGVQQVQEYATEGWKEVSLAIDGEGTHTIRWTYLRNSDRKVTGGDCAWLDGFSWMPPCGHSMTNVINAIAATCTEAGYTGDKVCEVCGEIMEVGSPIPAVGHVESPNVVNACAATCTEAGYTGDKVCEVCGEIMEVGSPIAALGHIEGDGVVTKEPTTAEEGVMTYYCTRCGTELRTEAIPRTEEVPVITFGDTYRYHNTDWDNGGYIERDLNKSNYIRVFADGADNHTHIALFEVLGASSKDEIKPAVENLGFNGTLTASVWTDAELRNAVLPPPSTMEEWESVGRSIDNRGPGDISGPCSFSYCPDIVYEYEGDNGEFEWPQDLWPDNKAVAGRFWVAVECEASEVGRWGGLDGGFRVWQSGTGVKSEQMYVTYETEGSWPCATNLPSLFRGVQLTNSDRYTFDIDIWDVIHIAYGVAFHGFWLESEPERPGAPLQITLPEAGILYMTAYEGDLEGIDVENADSVEVEKAPWNEWPNPNYPREEYFYQSGSYWPNRSVLAARVNSARTIRLVQEDEFEDYDFNRFQFFPSASRSVAVEASFVSILDKNRYQRSSGRNVGEYLQGYVTGTGVYKVGETVALTAVPAPGEAFDHWELKYGNFPAGIDTTKATLNFTVTDACAGTAEERKQMVVRAVWKAKRQIMATTDDITHGSVSGSGFYLDGASVTLTTQPAAGYEFVEWSDGVKTATRTVSVSGDAEYLARFRVGSGGDLPATLPSVADDPSAVVTGDAESGFVVKPSAANGAVEVTIPGGVDAAKVTVEVAPTVESVKANGANVRVKAGAHDITQWLDIPQANANGVIDMTKADVKQAVADEAMDTSKGAEVNFGDTTEPFLKTSATKPGLTYTLREGVTLRTMSDGATKQGDGEPWTPQIKVKGDASGFYTIKVGK